MPKIVISDDPGTGDPRTVEYDADGYTVRRGEHVVASGRLEAVCYLLDARSRERIARIYGLQEAGEMARARREWDTDHA